MNSIINGVTVIEIIQQGALQGIINALKILAKYILYIYRKALNKVLLKFVKIKF